MSTHAPITCTSSSDYKVNKDTFIGSKEDVNTWHNKLGHPSATVLSKVFKSLNIKFNESELLFCEACKEGKMHQKKHSPTATKSTYPFQLMFSDLWGPAHTPSTQAYKHYISFVDDYSGSLGFTPSQLSLKQALLFKTLLKWFNVNFM